MEHDIEKNSGAVETSNKASEQLGTNVHIDRILIKEWEQFDQQIKGQSDTQNVITSISPLRHQPMIHDPVIEEPSSKDLTLKEIKIIPKYSSSEIALSIEEIPPLDVFYSPKHRVVVKRKRKKRKIDQASTIVPQDESMNVI